MPIVFSDHAKAQLKRRGISQKRAIETVRDPQDIISSFKTRRLRHRTFGDKYCE